MLSNFSLAQISVSLLSLLCRFEHFKSLDMFFRIELRYEEFSFRYSKCFQHETQSRKAFTSEIYKVEHNISSRNVQYFPLNVFVLRPTRAPDVPKD